jgi:hypothetical protein
VGGIGNFAICKGGSSKKPFLLIPNFHSLYPSSKYNSKYNPNTNSSYGRPQIHSSKPLIIVRMVAKPIRRTSEDTKNPIAIVICKIRITRQQLPPN